MAKQNASKALPLGDPSWSGRAEATRRFLGKPRTWPEMDAWRKTAQIGPFMFRHYLAYLEHAGKARAFYQHEVLYWVANGATSRRSEPPPSPVTGVPPDTSDEDLLRQLLPEPEDELPEPEPQEEADGRSG